METEKITNCEEECENAFNKNVVDTIHYKIDFYNKNKAIYNEAFGRVFDMYRKKLYREIVEECDNKLDLLNELIERKHLESEIDNSNIIEDLPKCNNLDFGDFLLKNFIVVAPNFVRMWKYNTNAKTYTTEEAYKVFTENAR